MTDELKSTSGPTSPNAEPPNLHRTTHPDYTTSEDALQWFAQNGGQFVKVAAWNAKVKAPGKQALGDDWQNNPLTIGGVLPHVKMGGNVGLMCGCGNLGLLDIDANYQNFCKLYPELETAPAIIRDDADRAKVIIRIDGDMPEGRKFIKRTSNKTEWLSKGNQGVIPPSKHPSGKPYLLINADSPIPVMTATQLIDLVELWTSNPWKERPQAQDAPANLPQDGRGKLSKSTHEFIQHGAKEGARNQSLFDAACDMVGCGYSQSEAESILLSPATKSGTPEAEALSSIKSAYSKHRTPARPDAFTQEPAKMTTYIEPPEPETPPADFEQAELPQMPEAVRTRYQIIDGSFYAMDYDRDGYPKPKNLSNWRGKIIREVARDDGQDVTRRFVITGHLATGQKLPTCEVDATAFASMNWVIQQWGLRANIAAGQSVKDKLREAIQLESQDAEISTVYTHTGWREIEGKRVYLTTSGALGMDGITVDLDGNLKRYALPQDLSKANRQEAIRASLRFLEVAPKSVTFPLWGSMYLAPLAEISPFDFVMWVYGETGSMKSTLSALALCHYGEFDYKHLPEGWVSTDNILEKQTFVIKDAPLVIDDFAPQATAIDGQTYQRRAERLIRAIGDHIPRTRMNADTSTRTGFTSRGLVISTAEQLPSGQSIVGRLLPVEVFPKSVDTDKLTTAQNRDAALYPYALANYLCWLADNWQDLKKNYREWHREQRDSVRSLLKGDYHARTPEMFAHVLMGLRLALTYATEEKVITEKEAASMLTQAKQELITLAQAQGEHVKDELPAIKFIHAIKAMIAKGDYYIEGATISYPDNAKWLGWADKEFYYLQSEVTYNAVSEFMRKEGAALGLKQKALNSQLVQKGYTMKDGQGKNTYPAHNKEKGTLRTYAFHRHRFDE